MPGKQRRLVAVDSPRAASDNRSGRKRRGRPPGSPSLTRQVQDTILSLLRSGATLAAAAGAAGVSPRTLRDRLERGEGRYPTRSSTPKLRQFAKLVRQAQAEARVIAENRVFEESPKYWLAHAARGTPEDEGWADAPRGGRTDPRNQAGADGTVPMIDWSRLSHFSDEELEEALERLEAAMAKDGTFTSPPCPHPRCPCPFHKKNKERRRRDA